MGMIGVAHAIRNALLTAEPRAKVMAARQVARDWRLGRLAPVFDMPMPDRPARPARPELLPPRAMPRRRGGSQAAHLAMVHALAHIEFSAIDLALDMAGRFGGSQPLSFTSDWLAVAKDEAMHFALLDRHLHRLGSFYGGMPAHDGLWEAAEETSDDVLARLAVVPMVLEARGLDICPATIARFDSHGDSVGTRIVKRILTDEVKHVATGTFWFNRICESQGFASISTWQRLVRQRFRGQLKPPFNDSAREAAGLTRPMYMPLASLAESPQ